MRLTDKDALFDFLTDQLDKETGAYSKGRNAGINIARSALHDETVTPTITLPPNDPLTLKELREMNLFEWVWISVLRPSKRQVFRKIESAYYQIFEDYTEGEALCCGWPGLIHEFEYKEYGKTWLAYHRKLEEGTDNA